MALFQKWVEGKCPLPTLFAPDYQHNGFQRFLKGPSEHRLLFLIRHSLDAGKLQGMALTGCKNQKAIFLAFQTYMELCEVEILWNVEYHFSEELDLIYLSAADKPDCEGNLYLPISSSKIITPEWILKIQKQMEKRHNISSFTFVIKDQDSTSVHYKISPGLVTPLSPEAAKQKKMSDEKRQLFENEIKKRKSELIAAAKKASQGGESNKDKVSEENNCSDNDVCEEVPLTVTIDEDGDSTDNRRRRHSFFCGDSNQSKQVEVIEL